MDWATTLHRDKSVNMHVGGAIMNVMVVYIGSFLIIQLVSEMQTDIVIVTIFWMSKRCKSIKVHSAIKNDNSPTLFACKHLFSNPFSAMIA